MKAAQIAKYGSPDVIEIVEIDKPKPGKGQVLVKVHASSINPFDTKLREGAMPINFPFTLGLDIAGVVTEVGQEVSNFSVGNKVYGSGAVLAGATGAFAEFVATPASIVAKMPKNLNFDEAAALPLVGVSALQALKEHINLLPNQRILIHGGAGGIGHIAVQLAKQLGAFVVATANSEDAKYVKSLGAREIIDYKKERFEEKYPDFDAVFDTVGGEVFEKSFKVLKPGGILVSMVAQDDKKIGDQRGVKAISQFTKVSTERLDKLTEFIEKGAVKVKVDKVYSLDNIKEAFKDKESGNVKGKIVIEVKG